MVDAEPKFLLAGTIFGKLLGLRDTSIGDGQTTLQTAAAADDDQRDQSGVHVVEMSHNTAIYPAAGHADGTGMVQQQRPHPPRQTDGHLAMLTLWKRVLVDAFVSRLGPITGAATEHETQAAPTESPEPGPAIENQATASEPTSTALQQGTASASTSEQTPSSSVPEPASAPTAHPAAQIQVLESAEQAEIPAPESAPAPAPPADPASASTPTADPGQESVSAPAPAPDVSQGNSAREATPFLASAPSPEATGTATASAPETTTEVVVPQSSEPSEAAFSSLALSAGAEPVEIQTAYSAASTSSPSAMSNTTALAPDAEDGKHAEESGIEEEIEMDESYVQDGNEDYVAEETGEDSAQEQSAEEQGADDQADSGETEQSVDRQDAEGAVRGDVTAEQHREEEHDIDQLALQDQLRQGIHHAIANLDSNYTDENYQALGKLLEIFVYGSRPNRTSALPADSVETAAEHERAGAESKGLPARQPSAMSHGNHTPQSVPEESNATTTSSDEATSEDNVSNMTHLMSSAAAASSADIVREAELPENSAEQAGLLASSVGTVPADTQHNASSEEAELPTYAPEVTPDVNRAGFSPATPKPPLFPVRYPQARHALGSVVRAQLPAGVVGVDQSDGIAFKPTAADRIEPIELKPTGVFEGGDLDAAEFGLVRPRSVRDPLAEVTAGAQAGLSVVRPDWRRPGVLVTPLHRPVQPDTLCYLLVKQGACRCTRTNCSKFRKFMQHKCPGMCEAGECFQFRLNQQTEPTPDASCSKFRTSGRIIGSLLMIKRRFRCFEK